MQRSQKYRKESIHQKMSVLSQSNQSFSPNKACNSTSKYSQKSPSCNQVLKGFNHQKSINDQDLSFQVKLQNLNTKKPLQSTFNLSQPNQSESQQNNKQKMDQILHSQLDQSLKSGNPLSQTFKSFINKNEDRSSQYSSAQNSQSTQAILAQQINKVPIQLQQDFDIKGMLEQLMYENQSFDKSQENNQMKSLNYLIDVNMNQTQNETQLNFQQQVTPSMTQLLLQKQDNSLDILQLRNQIFQNQKPISLKDLQFVFAGRNESDQFPTEMFKTPTQGHNNEFFTFTAEEKKEQLLKNLMEKITIDENQIQNNENLNSNQSKFIAQNTQKGFQKRKSAIQMQFEPTKKLDLIGQILSAGSFKQRINTKCDKQKNRDLSIIKVKKMQNQMSLQELKPVRKFDTIINKNQLHRDASVNIINKNILDKENESFLYKSSSKQIKSQISQRNSKSYERIAKSFSGMTINLNFNSKIQEKSKNRPETVIRPSKMIDNKKDIEKTMEPMIILQKPQFEQKQNLSIKKNKINGQNLNQKSINITNFSQKRENKPRLSINSQLPQVSQFLSIATCKSNQYNSLNHASLVSTAQPTQRFSKIGNQKQFCGLNNNRSFSKIQDKSLYIQSSNSKIFKTFDHFKQKPSQQQSIQLGNKFKSVFSNQNNDSTNDKKNQVCDIKQMIQNKSQKILENFSSTKSVSVTRQKSQNVIGQAQLKNNLQSNYISQKKEDPETNYIHKVREQAEQAQKQLFRISQIQAQKKKEKLMKKNNGIFQNNVKDSQQAKLESKQFQNLLYNHVQRSKMDPNLMPILQNKNNPSVIRQTNKQTLFRPYQSKEAMGISAQVKILKQTSDISKYKNSNFNFDDLSKIKKESPSKQQQKNKQSNMINLNSQTSKSTIMKFDTQNEKGHDTQKKFISNITQLTNQDKQEFDSNKNQCQSQSNQEINESQKDFEQQIDNEYVTLQKKVKHLLFIDDNFEIIQNQDTETKNNNCHLINQNDKSEFNSQSQKRLQHMKGNFNEDFKIDFIQEVFCEPSQNIRQLNLSIQRRDINNIHQKSQAENASGSSSQKEETPYIDCQFFIIKTQERPSRRENRIQKRANQYKSMIERTNSRSKSNETKIQDQTVNQSINKEIYHDRSQDSQLVNCNKSQYTSSSLHHKKNSSSINKNIGQFSIERKNKFDKLQKSLKFLKINFGNVVKGYKARRIIYNIKELRESRLKAIVYEQLSQNNHQCYENKIMEHRQNLAFLFQRYWANNLKQSATDWIKMGEQKEVKNDKKQLNLEKQQVLDEIHMNIKFLQSLNNSEKKENKEDMMEDTVVFNNQNSISCKLESENNEIDKYIQNVDEDEKAIQIDMTDSVEDLDCTVQIQNTQINYKSNIEDAKSNNYRSTTRNQKYEKADSEISNQQSKKRYLQVQSKNETKTFRSMIPQIRGDNKRSRSQNRSKSRFSQESTRIPKINPIVPKKSIKLEKQQSSKNKNNLSNLSDLITVEIKPVISKPGSIRNDKKQLNKKRDIYQSYDEQGFTLQEKKSVCKDNSKKPFFEQKLKKHSQSKIQSPIKEITPQKQKIQKEDKNKENPEYKCSTQSKNQESTQSMNLQTSKSVQFFENQKVLEDEGDELCCEALKDLSNSSLNINNSFYSQNKISQGDKQSMFPQFPPEFMKLIELNKRKKELNGLDKFSKAQLKSAISELMKELDDNE